MAAGRSGFLPRSDRCATRNSLPFALPPHVQVAPVGWRCASTVFDVNVSLRAYLAALDAHELAADLDRRPDVLVEPTPASLDELAHRLTGLIRWPARCP